MTNDDWAPKHRASDQTKPDIPIQQPVVPPPWVQQGYPPLPPPPSPQLPDFKPKGMSTLDKILGWIIIFAVVIFLMIVASHYLLHPIAPKVITVICSTSPHLPEGSLSCKS